jgi:hypothetical protein
VERRAVERRAGERRAEEHHREPVPTRPAYTRPPGPLTATSSAPGPGLAWGGLWRWPEGRAGSARPV